jgi:hypothetical protein
MAEQLGRYFSVARSAASDCAVAGAELFKGADFPEPE